MTAAIRSIATAVPETIITQESVRDLLAGQPGIGAVGKRIMRAAFDASGIRTRHTVLAELDPAAPAGGGEPAGSSPARFVDRATGCVLTPGTGLRNDVYIEAAQPLLLEAARRAVEEADGIEAGDITHVVTVSCTGFFAPGPDYAVVRGLGLDPATQRFHLGFMGCYAAFPALRLASQLCAADPRAVVLVVCIELCTLHMRSSEDPDQIRAAALFADGAAASIVTARPAPTGATVLQLDAFETVLTPIGEADMAWTIGDHGFDMVLSSYVPRIIDSHITDALAPLIRQVPELAGVPHARIEHWGIHPGGRSILDKVEERLALAPAQLEPSRSTLAEVGNMSSATVLFVLRRILHGAPSTAEGPGADRVCAMAFGPGLTVESALMSRRTV